jgi:GTPase SAR1 family protein
MVLLGLDNSGKTTLLYLLSRGEVMPAVSTIGYNHETFSINE